MENDKTVSEVDLATPCLKEDAMETMMESVTAGSTHDSIWTNPCLHGRMIDDVLTRSGKRTGKVRCLECGTIVDDPYQGSK